MQMKAAGVALVLTLLGSAQAAVSQEFDLDVGYGAGYATFGSVAKAAGGDVSLEDGWITSWHVDDWWAGRRLGWRVGGVYTRRPLTVLDRARPVWSLEGGLAARPLPVKQGVAGVSPYFFAGAGSIWYDFGKASYQPIPGTTVPYDAGERQQWLVSGGLGIDIYPGWMLGDDLFGLRIEGADIYVFDSPFRGSGAAQPSHNFRVTLSIESGLEWIF